MNFFNEFLEKSKASGIISSATEEMYRVDLEDFKNFLNGKEEENVQENDILEYIKFLRTKYQENSVFRKYSSVKGFYKYLLKKNIIDVLPMERITLVRSGEKIPEVLEFGEIKAISDACEKNSKGRRDKLIIKILTDIGVQIAEVLEMKISDLEKYNYEYFSIIKNGKMVLMELSEELSGEINKFIEEDRENLISGSSDYIFYGLSRQNFRARFLVAGKKAGIEREISPNMLRNTSIKEREKYEYLDENGDALTLLNRIKEEYIRIGIGDD